MITRSLLNETRRSFFRIVTGMSASLASWPAAASVSSLGRETAPEGKEAQPPSASEGSSMPTLLGGKTSRDRLIEAVEQAYRNILAEGVDHIFPEPFEVDRLRKDPELKALVVGAVCDSIANPGRTPEGTIFDLAIPKTTMFGIRQCSHIEITETVRYLAYVLLIARTAESARIPVEANRVISFRYNPTGAALFDPRYGYQYFADQVRARICSNGRTFLVGADIADFYPSIDRNRLADVLLRHGTEAPLLAAIETFLSRWSHTPGRGLPVGSNASRILSEAALINVDRNLLEDGVDFIRFVDDYRLFAPNMMTARRWLELIMKRLAEEGLSLNHAKTSIDNVTPDEFEILLKTRRARRYWGIAGTEGPFKLSQNQPAPPAQPAPNAAPKAVPDANKRKNNKPQPNLPSEYNTKTPLKKSNLNGDDLVLLASLDTGALSQRLSRSAHSGRISLGDFRLLIEGALHHGRPEQLTEAFALLDINGSSHCIAYLVDVLIEEADRIPSTIREQARQWFAARLTNGRCTNDYELMQVTDLLGMDEYADRQSLFSYLQAYHSERSPVAVRRLLASIENYCDEEQALALAAMSERANDFVKRAMLTVAWPRLDKKIRFAIRNKHPELFKRDVFLSALDATSQAEVA